MSETNSYVPKHGDVSVFVNNKKEKETHPLLWGKAYININELKDHANEEGMVELKISLWGYSGKNGSYWSGKMQVPQTSNEQTNALPPSVEPEPVKEKGKKQAKEEYNDLPF